MLRCSSRFYAAVVKPATHKYWRPTLEKCELFHISKEERLAQKTEQKPTQKVSEKIHACFMPAEKAICSPFL